MNRELKIDGVVYKAIENRTETKKLICVDNRGLLFVGNADLSGENEEIIIRNARCVIQWGTSGHVAELINGPLENTKLGAKADVTVYRKNIVFWYSYRGDPAVWDK